MANMTTTPIVALDVASAEDALRIVTLLGPRCRFYKVGSELFTAAGPDIVRRLRDRGADVFLDLKLHDIPNTVRGAVRSAAALGARLLTVHAVGGRAMLEAAGEAAGDGLGILAVTALTSFDHASLAAAMGRERVSIADEVGRLAALANDAGLHGVVCAGSECAMVRGRFQGKLEVLVPGIRLAGGAAHDQRRVVTPSEAAASGARYIVVGRAVTAAPDPCSAMDAVAAGLESVGV